MRHYRSLPLAIATACNLSLACICSCAAAASENPSSPRELLSQARRIAAQTPAPCRAHPPMARSDGTAVASPMISTIPGAAAGTTGGLGKRILNVTSADDVKPSKSYPWVPGSLRWAVEQARASGGAWIAFDPVLQGRTIRLESTLRLPSNVTVDGGCSGIEILAPAHVTQITITDAENIVVSGLSFTKEPYDDKADKTGDAIGITNLFDRVAILHNSFHRCGDGCVDIVRKERFTRHSRATVAFNRFAEHNKVMLIGTLTCYVDRHAPGCDAPLRHLDSELAPAVFVTVTGNVFDGTSQRHPKVVSNAMVHLVNNFFTFAPTPYSDELESAVYGAAAGTGGVLVAEANIFINPDRPMQIGVGSITAVRRASGGGTEGDGAVAAGNNVAIGAIRVVEHEPALARGFGPPQTPIVPVGPANAAQIAACLLRYAGPKGAGARWPEVCAGP